MKRKQRSVDYDGLDGILQLPETLKNAPKWYRTPWLYALVVIGLAGTFLLYKQNQNVSPQIVSVQTDTTVTSQASNYSPEQETDNWVPKNPEPETDSPQTESPPEHQNPTVSTEDSSEHLAADNEQSLATSKTEASAATSSDSLFTVHFKFNSSKLNLLSKSEQDDLIKAAKSCSIIKLTGHTCNMGPAAINKRIGLARADSVKKLLLASGIPTEKITLASEGMDSPAVPNDTPIMAAQNRRVELTCLDR
ncbi:OmpA family protein [Methylomonas methanica]|uniref:OmpA/MotB domain protein n=1 Tax=Methylomonas methanica (strain DSM 25384 / MC09) TaxID=857087 RepID=G0A7I2_METMM|nr:OmpA family protein [Methylomonas methanica]AEG00652.1 OmpA/MotB domain protein [Methylomonas methanica MC09]